MMCSAMALSLPPLQQKSIGSGVDIKCSKNVCSCRDGAQRPLTPLETSAAPLQQRSLVPAIELVSHAGAHIASERGKADGVLILLVEKVGSAGVEREATAHVIARRQIESRVAWVFKLGGAGEIAVGAASGEIARETPVHSAP